MVKLPAIGTWWLVDAPRRKVSGVLDQARNGRLSLQTHDGLIDEMSSSGPRTVYGDLKGIPVTLRDADWTSISGMYPQSHETWQATNALVGLHLQERHRFAAVEIRSEYLDRWADEPQWKWDTGPNHALHIHDPGPLLSSKYNEGTVNIGYGTSISPRSNTWSISRSTVLIIRLKKLIDITECLNVVRQTDTLLDAIFARRTAATSVVLYQRGTPQRSQRPIEFLGYHAAPELAAGPDNVDAVRHELCRFDDFGGIDGVGKWFGLDRDYRHLAGRVMSQFRNEGRYLEDTAMSTFATGEALDRTETGTTTTKARTRWKRLATQVPEFGYAFIHPRPEDDWAHLVVTERDRLAHVLGPETNQHDAERMIALSQSAQMLNVLTLLRLAGLQPAIHAASSTPRWANSRAGYQAAMRGAGL